VMKRRNESKTIVKWMPTRHLLFSLLTILIGDA
jgi:hypothetical protein